jgi:hypothetical protein
MSFLTLLSSQTNDRTIVLDQLSSTTQVFNPTVVQPATTQTVVLNLLNSTTTVYNPTVVPGSVTINLNRLESTTTVYNLTVIQPGTTQTITLDLLNSTTQIFLPIISLTTAILDTSDILDRYRRKTSESKEEEQIAAQLLKARQKRPQVEQKVRKLRNLKKLIYDAIYGAETVEEVDAITTPPVPVDSPEIVAAVLAEIEEQKALRRAEIKLKMEEASLKAAQLESQINDRIEAQKQAINAIKQLQEEVMTRHAVAVEAARQMELQAFLQLQDAERKAEEFTRKRNNRIKRLKALMWLAKIDL